MIVADGSAVVAILVNTVREGVRERLWDGVAAPHLIDAEIGQAMRGLVLRNALQLDDAEELRRIGEGLVVRRFEHRRLGARAWELRDNVSFYDGLYVALAERLGVPLLTADRRLAVANGPRCPIELV